LEVALPGGEWIYGYILSFGSLVEVLEPAHVRKSIAERTRQVLKIYEP
jgi:predicted DNA-binding transcriptional regulator YafY